MPRRFRVGLVAAGAAFAAGWAYRAVFPKVTCPGCGSARWKRLGGGLKQCRECSYKFFMPLPDPKGPATPS
jgi:ribosomal protein L37AE/L43A